ncbi:MAG: hypothetical protein AUJ72_04285 [Candidatus Omnitrophica bacterium CG1_02_46_14]|nr:MAG: hypothetical protein AUJ72_04285 [Candidatus Omnitrophica bacterium CG1_02_46_14]
MKRKAVFVVMDSITQKLDLEILSVINPSCESVLTKRDFETLALKIFRYQFKKNTHYRQFCLMEHKPPKSVKRWRDIPAIPAVGFKELTLSTFPIKRAVKVFKTSGTTGREASASTTSTPAWRQGRDAPIHGAHFFDSLKLYEAAILPSFRRYLMPDGEDLLFYFLTHSPKDAPHSSLSYMMGVVNHAFAGGKGKFYVKKNEIQFKSLADDLKAAQRSVLILSTAFGIKSFLDYLSSHKISFRLPVGSRLMETGGFKGSMNVVSRNKLYSLCKRRLGIPKNHCVSEYGMTELSSQFYDTTLRDKMDGISRKPIKQGPAWTRTLVIDPKTSQETKKGRVGSLRHFDLANRGSVIAIQTEDLGREVDGGFELLGRAKGSPLRGCSLSYEEFLHAPK